MIERFGQPDRFVSVGVALVEQPPFGEGERQPGTAHHGGKHREAEPLTGRIALEQLHQSPTEVFGPSIVARDVARRNKVVLGYDLERHIAERLGDGLDCAPRSVRTSAA